MVKVRGLAPHIAVIALLAMSGESARAAPPDLYQKHCASCHGMDRLGSMGPALLPENLARLKPQAAEEVILRGRHATQMPAFADVLSQADTRALVDYIYAPVHPSPAWSREDIQASRIVHRAAQGLSGKPVFDADPLNLFVVVEAGDHHATILDGGKLEPLARFPTRYALHGGPKFSPEGRYVFLPPGTAGSASTIYGTSPWLRR
ncbi:MAG: c-type cytochrome [Burkholderiales bacterium]